MNDPVVPTKSRVLQGVLIGVLVFGACFVGFRWLGDRFELGAFAKQWLFKPGLIVASLVVWLAARRPLSEMGFRRSTPLPGLWRWYGLGALGLGGSSIAMILLDARHPIVAQLTFPQIMVTVWLLSSVAEEIFVRGLVQSWMEPPPSRAAIIASAGLFGAMHAPLMWSGAGVAGGAVIVAATLVVGFAAATVRSRTGSLKHAIGVHIVANVAALPFGVIGALTYRAIHGVMPHTGG